MAQHRFNGTEHTLIADMLLTGELTKHDLHLLSAGERQVIANIKSMRKHKEKYNNKRYYSVLRSRSELEQCCDVQYIRATLQRHTDKISSSVATLIAKTMTDQIEAAKTNIGEDTIWQEYAQKVLDLLKYLD